MSAHALTWGLTGEKNIINVVIQQCKAYDSGIFLLLHTNIAPNDKNILFHTSTFYGIK